MNRPRLTLADLVGGLTKYGAQYTEINVFADDVHEIHDLRAGEPARTLRPLDAVGRRFLFEHAGCRYHLELDERGVATVRRPDPDVGSIAVGTAFGGMAGAAIGSAASKKGEGWAAGLFLGMLAGATLAATSSQAKPPRRVLTMRFDPEARNWVAYDGGLVAWMKSELQSAS